MSFFRFVALSALVLFCGVATAEDRYPNHPVTLVVGYSAGGLGDGVARQIAEFARQRRGATIVVDFKPGASSTIATGFIKRSAADGYTLGFLSPSALYVLPHLQKLPYDPLKDFSYLGLVMAQPYPLYVRADSPFKTFNDVLAYARANPGKFRWGTAGANTLGQILMQSALNRDKVDAPTIPFKGGSDAINALLGGHIEGVVSSDFGPMLAAGKVRLIVETGETRPMPDVPTLKELGYPLAVTLKYGVFGPAGLPAEVVNWWDTLLKEFAASPAYAEFTKRNYGVPIYASPAEVTRHVQQTYNGMETAIKTLDLKPN
jgi:tripartite-type tricarboxylate transporter receptor subunit TctC